jgi:N-acetyl-beta-hexosaminidase
LGKKLPETSQPSASSIVFKKQADLAEEAYHLIVTPTQITISASSKKGFLCYPIAQGLISSRSLEK